MSPELSSCVTHTALTQLQAAPCMASLELLECAGCGLLKVRQEGKKYRLRSPAISVGGTELAQGTIVCGSCAPQTHVGGQAVQLRATAALSAARHAMQTCAPGQEQRSSARKKQRSEQSVWEEALLAFEDSLPASASAEEAEETEERRGWRRRSLKPPPNREAAISREEAIQRVQAVLPPDAAPPASIVISAGSSVPFGSQHRLHALNGLLAADSCLPVGLGAQPVLLALLPNLQQPAAGALQQL
jgi:hypothetical protein